MITRWISEPTQLSATDRRFSSRKRMMIRNPSPTSPSTLSTGTMQSWKISSLCGTPRHPRLWNPWPLRARGAWWRQRGGWGVARLSAHGWTQNR